MTDIQLLLVDPNPALCQALQSAFSGIPSAAVVPSYFEHLPAFGCMVSAANSFGLMDS